MNKKHISKKKILLYTHNIYLLLALIFMASCGKADNRKNNNFPNHVEMSLPIVNFAYSYSEKALYGDYFPMIDSQVGPGICVEIDRENNFYNNNQKINIEEFKKRLREKTIERGANVPVFLLADKSIKGELLHSTVKNIYITGISNIRIGVIKNNKEHAFIFFRSCHSKDYPSKTPITKVFSDRVEFDGNKVTYKKFITLLASIKGKPEQLVRYIEIEKNKWKSVIFDFDEKVSLQKIVEIISICNKSGVECRYLVDDKTVQDRGNYMSKFVGAGTSSSK